MSRTRHLKTELDLPNSRLNFGIWVQTLVQQVTHRYLVLSECHWLPWPPAGDSKRQVFCQNCRPQVDAFDIAEQLRCVRWLLRDNQVEPFVHAIKSVGSYPPDQIRRLFYAEWLSRFSWLQKKHKDINI